MVGFFGFEALSEVSGKVCGRFQRLMNETANG